MGTEKLIAEPTTQFNFQENKVEVLTLDTLRRTHKENDVFGRPLKGIYHYQVMDKITDMCDYYNLNYEVEELFAAQNANKNAPGVAVLPQIEEQFGERAVEAHILRRVYGTIAIRNWEDDELTTNLVVAYHQDGIQMAIGPCVKICHNQCILSPERMVSNFGPGKVSTEQMFETVDSWLSDFEQQMTSDREKIKMLKSKVMKAEDVLRFIGLLVTARVAHDSQKLAKVLSEDEKVKVYPLNQGQISEFTEELMLLQRKKKKLTAWDVYNTATELYKPGKTDIPVILGQNFAMAEMLGQYC